MCYDFVSSVDPHLIVLPMLVNTGRADTSDLLRVQYLKTNSCKMSEQKWAYIPGGECPSKDHLSQSRAKAQAPEKHEDIVELQIVGKSVTSCNGGGGGGGNDGGLGWLSAYPIQ